MGSLFCRFTFRLPGPGFTPHRESRPRKILRRGWEKPRTGSSRAPGSSTGTSPRSRSSAWPRPRRGRRSGRARLPTSSSTPRPPPGSSSPTRRSSSRPSWGSRASRPTPIHGDVPLVPHRASHGGGLHRGALVPAGARRVVRGGERGARLRGAGELGAPRRRGRSGRGRSRPPRARAQRCSGYVVGDLPEVRQAGRVPRRGHEQVPRTRPTRATEDNLFHMNGTRLFRAAMVNIPPIIERLLRSRPGWAWRTSIWSSPTSRRGLG